MLIRDFLNRELKFNAKPQRLVSLVPSQTELLVDLGLESSIVGLTKFCVHPKHLKSSKTVVGGTKQIRLDKVIKLKPDVILCNKEENTLEMVNELEKIAPVHVSDIKTIDDNIRLIEDYSKIFQTEAKGEILKRQLLKARLDFQNFIINRPKLKVAYLIWREPCMAVGGDTFINHVLELNNFENVFASQSRYPDIDIDNLPDLDLLLLSSEPFPFKEKYFDEIPIENSIIKIVDGEFFSWYGSRIIKAFDYFEKLRKSI